MSSNKTLPSILPSFHCSHSPAAEEEEEGVEGEPVHERDGDGGRQVLLVSTQQGRAREHGARPPVRDRLPELPARQHLPQKVGTLSLVTLNLISCSLP